MCEVLSYLVLISLITDDVEHLFRCLLSIHIILWRNVNSNPLWYSVAQSCLTLCSPTNCSPPGSSVHRIFQTRLVQWDAIHFPGGLPNPVIELGSLLISKLVFFKFKSSFYILDTSSIRHVIWMCSLSFCELSFHFLNGITCSLKVFDFDVV